MRVHRASANNRSGRGRISALALLLLVMICAMQPTAGLAQHKDGSRGNGTSEELDGQAALLLFHETCDDAAFNQRGWYDNNSLRVSADERLSGSKGALEFRFLKGASTPISGGGVRRLFTPTPTVYLSYWVKYSANWEGSNRPYHPHEFHFITDVDDKWIGPAATHLTTYIEHNEGRALLSMQDALNIDESNIGRDLTNITENRAVAGCNGSSDAWPAGDCYRSGSTHRNGKMWKSQEVVFSDTPGPLYKNSWRFVEALFSLNSIVEEKGVADGELRMWVDGEVVVDAAGVMLRTGRHQGMQFNQFLAAPYIGDGSPVEQTMWVDEIVVATGRMAVLDRPALLSPSNGATVDGGDQLVKWAPVAGAALYSIERADDSLFSTGAGISTAVGDTTLLYSGLAAGTKVWWRVRAENPAGRGEWSDARMFVVDGPTDVDYAAVPHLASLVIAPNPVRGMASLRMSVAKDGWIELSLFDALGRRGEVILNSWMGKGEHECSFDAARLRPGLYLARLISSDEIICEPLIVRH
jgi:hypothetical protein